MNSKAKLERLADRGRPRGADAVLAAARAVDDGPPAWRRALPIAVVALAVAGIAGVAVVAAGDGDRGQVVASQDSDRTSTSSESEAAASSTSSTAPMAPPARTLPVVAATFDGRLVRVEPDGSQAALITDTSQIGSVTAVRVGRADGTVFFAAASSDCDSDIYRLAGGEPEIVLEEATSPAVDPAGLLLAAFPIASGCSAGASTVLLVDLATGVGSAIDLNSAGDGLELVGTALAWTSPDRLLVLTEMRDGEVVAGQLVLEYARTFGGFEFQRQVAAPSDERWTALASADADAVLTASTATGAGGTTVVRVARVSLTGQDAEPVVELPGDEATSVDVSPGGEILLSVRGGDAAEEAIVLMGGQVTERMPGVRSAAWLPAN